MFDVRYSTKPFVDHKLSRLLRLEFASEVVCATSDPNYEGRALLCAAGLLHQPSL